MKLREKVIQEKLARIRGGGKARMLDLFAGCGGMTLGFKSAGFDPVGAVESDPAAVRTYAWNFHQENLGLHGKCSDIRELSKDPRAYIGDLTKNNQTPETEIDLIVGGPPCPTFSVIGRAKINDEANKRLSYQSAGKKSLYLQDERNYLYDDYLEFVKHLCPVAVVMENVGGFISQSDVNHGEEVAEKLAEWGYRSKYSILNSAWYGVPQNRDRFFLVAFHEKVFEGENAEEWTFPGRLCDEEDSKGMAQNRKRFWNLREAGEPSYKPSRGKKEEAKAGDHACPSYPRFAREKMPFTSAKKALGDLPKLDIGRPCNAPTWRRDDQMLSYASSPHKESYARLMRHWKGFTFKDGRKMLAHHHVCRRTMVENGRDRRVFKELKPGDAYPEAHEISERLFERKKEREFKKLGRRLRTTEVKNLKQRYVLPYPKDSFKHRWVKLDPKKPSRTLTAHLGKDTYSHIHFDREQARMITVQEAARLQSFPDGFNFHCSMNDAFKQIGNAVPPLVAYFLGAAVRSTLLGKKKKRPEPTKQLYWKLIQGKNQKI